MALTPVPTIDPALPIPPNPADDEAVFDAKAYAWSEALPGFGSDVKSIGDATYANAQWAETKAGEAATSASDASTSETNAGLSATAAACSAASASTLVEKYLDVQAIDPTTGRGGAPLVDGNWYVNSVSGFIRAYTVSGGWVNGISAVAGVSSVNGQTGDIVLPPGIINIAYDHRAQLRSNSTGLHALVEGLGLFQYVSGSDEPDDDESCFATATGRWLLQAAHWDLIDAWQLPEVEERDAYDEDEPLRFAASFAAKVITGSASCAITSVAGYASASFTGTITGAAVGDRVIATPPAQLGAGADSTWRLGYHAFVSAANTVTVMLINASGSDAITNPAIRTAWPITVIKP